MKTLNYWALYTHRVELRRLEGVEGFAGWRLHHRNRV